MVEVHTGTIYRKRSYLGEAASIRHFLCQPHDHQAGDNVSINPVNTGTVIYSFNRGSDSIVSYRQAIAYDRFHSAKHDSELNLKETLARIGYPSFQTKIGVTH